MNILVLQILVSLCVQVNLFCKVLSKKKEDKMTCVTGDLFIPNIANNKEADQSTHLRSLVWVFVVSFLSVNIHILASFCNCAERSVLNVAYPRRQVLSGCCDSFSHYIYVKIFIFFSWRLKTVKWKHDFTFRSFTTFFKLCWPYQVFPILSINRP